MKETRFMKDVMALALICVVVLTVDYFWLQNRYLGAITSYLGMSTSFASRH